jgi:hypothetical protein
LRKCAFTSATAARSAANSAPSMPKLRAPIRSLSFTIPRRWTGCGNEPLSATTYQHAANEETDAVPQIWLTYDELATLIGCDATVAHATAAAIPLDRRRSHDGHTRAKLNAQLTEIFLDRLARLWLDREIATCAGDLHAMRGRMATRPVVVEHAPAAIAS